MGKNSFILYTEIWPAIQKLDMEQRGKLFTAIMKHSLGEAPEKLDILTDVIFAFIASQMDRAEEKYQEVCRKRAEYGRKGGLAKASKSKQKLANVADSDSEPERDSEPEPERDPEPEPDRGLERGGGKESACAHSVADGTATATQSEEKEKIKPSGKEEAVFADGGRSWERTLSAAAGVLPLVFK